jgi:hypothetical protein
MSLTPAQIELLPPEQKAQVIALQTQMVRPCATPRSHMSMLLFLCLQLHPAPRLTGRNCATAAEAARRPHLIRRSGGWLGRPSKALCLHRRSLPCTQGCEEPHLKTAEESSLRPGSAAFGQGLL